MTVDGATPPKLRAISLIDVSWSSNVTLIPALVIAMSSSRLWACLNPWKNVNYKQHKNGQSQNKMVRPSTVEQLQRNLASEYYDSGSQHFNYECNNLQRHLTSTRSFCLSIEDMRVVTVTWYSRDRITIISTWYIMSWSELINTGKTLFQNIIKSTLSDI